MTTLTASRWSQVANDESPRNVPSFCQSAHEDVLRDLVGVAAGGHPADEAVHARQVRPVELLERAHVSRRGARHVGSSGSAAGRESTGERSANASKLHPYTSLDGLAGAGRLERTQRRIS